MTITTIAINTDMTREMRVKLATDNIVLYSALDDVEKKALWLNYYNALASMEDSSGVMDVDIPEI